MKITADQLREFPKFAEWKLYVHKFPSWIPEEQTWPTSQGISVSLTYMEKAINSKNGSSDGIIIITFTDASMARTLRIFLNSWMNGCTQQPADQSRIAGSLIDENEVEAQRPITLSFPITVNIGDEFPSVKAVYWE